MKLTAALLFLAFFPKLAMCQSGYYYNQAVDSNNIYFTSTFDWASGNWPNAWHSYYIQSTISSPSSRNAGNSENASAPASQAETVSAEASIAIDPGTGVEEGDYAETSQVNATCTQAGNFINYIAHFTLSIGTSDCMYNNPNYTSSGGGYCLYARKSPCPALACPDGVGAPSYQPCAPYARVHVLWFSTDGRKTAVPVTVYAPSLFVTDPGSCQEHDYVGP